ncbi:hypothetical protein Tco_0017804 [Tanacetum coccineum]
MKNQTMKNASDTGVPLKQQQQNVSSKMLSQISNFKQSEEGRITAAESQAVEKRGKPKNILEGCYKNSLKAFKYPNQKLEKGYDRFQQLLSQLEASCGLEVSNERCKISFSDLCQHEVLCGFADEVILFPLSKQTEDLDVLYGRFGTNDDVDMRDGTSNWQIAMIAIQMKKFYKKTGRRVRVDGKTPVGNVHTMGTNDGKKRETHFINIKKAEEAKEKNQMGLLTMDDGIVNWGEHTEAEETNHALMAISSSNEANEIYEKDEKLKRYRRIGMKAVKEKEQLQKTVDSWKDSSKNL